ncbi:tetratricopeptide repeat protein [Streptomyces niveus]|uniref:tetratricopeptide repeat protein n=1 Tax=Streptomyces niveus TaxID=193462 RepID=UPI000688FD71|nr:tetratricopeptide repeat protein [Streptomyces niveus]
MGGQNTLSGTVYGPVVQAAVIHGDVYFSNPVPDLPRHVPRQLPPVPSHFTNRSDSAAALDAMLTPDASSLAMISGPPGVGKSSLAVTWLHRHRDDFPDGQLYVDLRGNLADEPVAPSTVLPRFLHALGMRPEHVPTGLTEQTALFRTLTAELRIAVLCDNAFSAAQARALVPAGNGSICVVTSRRPLTSLLLDGAKAVRLEPLGADSAVELLGRIAGRERIVVDHRAAHELVAACGCFPLAVCVGAALLSIRPGWSIADVAADLFAGVGPGHEEFSMNMCLDQAYAVLPPGAALLYRRLGVHPGPEFDVGIAAAVAAAESAVIDVPDALAALMDASLLSSPRPSRYRFHDLIHRHAASLAAKGDFSSQRIATVRRILDQYLVTADSADHVLYPERRRPAPDYFTRPPEPAPFLNVASALEWFDAERENLMAVQRLAVEHGMDTAAWQIADVMYTLFSSLGFHQDWITAYEAGAEAARACGHALGEARLRTGLGIALRDVGRSIEALLAFDAAAALRREIGDRRGEALVLHHTAVTRRNNGDTAGAAELLRAAVAIQGEVGDRRGKARSIGALGEIDSLTGRHDEAIALLRTAHGMLAGTGDRHEVLVERLLGEAYARSGDRTAARSHLGAALDRASAIGVLFDEGIVCEALGALDENEGEWASARHRYMRAEALYRGWGALQEAQRASGHAARLGPATGPVVGPDAGPG